MKCAQVRPLLAALAGGDPGGHEAAVCRAHLAGCADCSERLETLRGTIGLLHAAGRATVPPDGFAAALQARLVREPVPPVPLSARLWRRLERLGLDSGPRLGLALGGAALSVLAVAVPLQLRRAPADAVHGVGVHGTAPAGSEQVIAASFRVPSQRIAVVRLDFVADVSVEDVDFEVTLPSGLQFVDAGRVLAEQTLSWRGSLLLGSNPIPLAVRGARPGRYRVTAQARGAGLDVRHDILLEVVPS